MGFAWRSPCRFRGWLNAAAFAASDNRGTWLWTSEGDPYGSAAIVGNSAREDDAITRMTGFGISRVYGTYGDRPVTAAAVVGAWNAKLDAAGIDSQLCLAENTWIFPAVRPGLMTYLQTYVIDFNAGRSDPAERFKAVHLDIEPQGMAAWAGYSPTEKRDVLNLLRDTFRACRAYLDANGGSGIPIYADLPVWFDSTAAIGWSSEAERDAWFTAIGGDLAGYSLMAYERSTLGDLMGMCDQVETLYSSAAGCDIHSFSTLMAAVPEPSGVALLAVGVAVLIGGHSLRRRRFATGAARSSRPQAA